MAACSDLMDEYVDVVASKEYRDAMPPIPPNDDHKCLLRLSDIDEIIKDIRVVKHDKSCKDRDVTDEDAKEFAELFKEPSENDTETDFDKELCKMLESAMDSDNKSNNSKPMPPNFNNVAKPTPSKTFANQCSNNHSKAVSIAHPLLSSASGVIKKSFPSPSFANQRSNVQRDEIPRKIPALAASVTHSSSPDLMEKIKNSFKRKSDQAATRWNKQAEQIRNSSNNIPEPKWQMPKSNIPLSAPEEDEVFEPPKSLHPDFMTASRALKIQNVKNFGNANQIQPKSSDPSENRSEKKRLGYHNFPVRAKAPEPQKMEIDEEKHPLLAGIDEDILETIKRDIINCTKDVTWDDVAGLTAAKQTIYEAVVLPFLCPDLFTGLRIVTKGILLFGPPGTGKTLIGKCIASQVNATFFSVSASTLTSKWMGQGEKLVKALFLYARAMQPSVIFFDEIDSILSKRNENEHESTRRLKTEFLVQLDGAHTASEGDRLLFLGATNRPQELDDAARRRFTKRLYIPLPDLDVSFTNLSSKFN